MDTKLGPCSNQEGLNRRTGLTQVTVQSDRAPHPLYRLGHPYFSKSFASQYVLFVMNALRAKCLTYCSRHRYRYGFVQKLRKPPSYFE